LDPFKLDTSNLVCSSTVVLATHWW